MRSATQFAIIAVFTMLAVRQPVAQEAAFASPAPKTFAMSDDPAVNETACATHPYSMQITVRNVKEAVGTITVDVHDDDPEKFLKSGGKLARIRVPAVQGETTFCVTVPGAGIYALALYHDRNGNKKLDKTWIGLPSEPFALSNNPPRRLAMPRHKDSAFEVNGQRTPVVVELD